MHTFENKPKATQQTASAKSAIPGRANFGRSREANAILHLQHTIGNQAVRRILKNIGDGKGDSTTAETARFDFDFRRIPVHSSAPAGMQPNLMVNTSGDIYEQEADQVAEQVMRIPETSAHRQSSTEAEEQDRFQGSETTQPALVSEAPPIVHEVLDSPGQLLDAQTRAFFEPRFGHDFSRVRVHADAKADESAKAVAANAYTVGGHIAFAEGRYQPTTQHGRELIAHELTHVVQQRVGLIPGRLEVGSVKSSAEGEANRASSEKLAESYGIRPMKGVQVSSFHCYSDPAPVLQRQSATGIGVPQHTTWIRWRRSPNGLQFPQLRSELEAQGWSFTTALDMGGTSVPIEEEDIDDSTPALAIQWSIERAEYSEQATVADIIRVCRNLSKTPPIGTTEAAMAIWNVMTQSRPPSLHGQHMWGGSERFSEQIERALRGEIGLYIAGQQEFAAAYRRRKSLPQSWNPATDPDYQSTQGFLDRDRSVIYILGGGLSERRIIHELLHACSYDNLSWGRNVTEGVTEYYAEEICRQFRYPWSGGTYTNQRIAVEGLIRVVEDHLILEAYFDGDIASVEAKVDTQKGPNTFKNWLNAMNPSGGAVFDSACRKKALSILP